MRAFHYLAIFIHLRTGIGNRTEVYGDRARERARGRENERRRMTRGGPGWIEVGFMSAHKSPHQAPAGSNARHGGWKLQGGFRHRFGGREGGKEGKRVVGHTNEAAWFQLFSKLNTGGVGLYGRSSEFQRYRTEWWISRRRRERVETATAAIVSRREGYAGWAPVIYG